MNSNSTTSGVSQNVATTIGDLYELTFYVGSATDGVFFFPATVDLSIDGGPRTSYTNPNTPTNMLNWMAFTVQFTALSNITNITLFNGGASNNFNSALDNVTLLNDSVGIVPEPASLTLFAIGAAGLLLSRVRRRRRVAGSGGFAEGPDYQNM